jgi:hypothetical protein
MKIYDKLSAVFGVLMASVVAMVARVATSDALAALSTFFAVFIFGLAILNFINDAVKVLKG